MISRNSDKRSGLAYLLLLSLLFALTACGGSSLEPSQEVTSAEAPAPPASPAPAAGEADQTTPSQVSTEETQETPEFSISQICKAGIGIVMGRDPATMKSSVDGDLVSISYVRADDSTVWSYRCKVEGDRIVWASDEGRWRNSVADETILFRAVGGRLEVEERYGDGSSNQKTFTREELGD